jgi:hypothetical protein
MQAAKVRFSVAVLSAQRWEPESARLSEVPPPAPPSVVELAWSAAVLGASRLSTKYIALPSRIVWPGACDRRLNNRRRRSLMIEARKTLAAMIVTVTFIGMPALAIGQDRSARNIDQFTCKEIMQESNDGRATSIAFLHGFLLGKAGSSAFDLDTMAKQTDSFIDYCLDNPKEKAVTAMMKVK